MQRLLTDLPHSVEAEQALLGAILLDNAAIHQVGSLREQDFYRENHRRIYRTMRALLEQDKPSDVVTIAEALEAAGELERVGGLPYLASLAENTPSAANVTAYAELVRERARMRYVQLALSDGLAMLADGKGRSAASIVTDVQTRLEAITAHQGGQTMALSEVLSAGLTAAKAAADRCGAGGVAGVPTGLRAIDDRTGGLHGPRLWIVAGRPGLGKTGLTLQWALHAAQRGHAVGIVSLEMGADEMAARALANRFAINSAALMHGDAEQFQRLKTIVPGQAYADFKGAPVLFDFESTDLHEILCRIGEWRRTHRIDYAIVDHVGLIEADGFTTRNEQLGYVSRAFKKLSKRLDMPIIAVSQLNRNVEKEKRWPELADLRDSGSLEQDADVVLMLHSEGGDGSELMIGLLKNRAGVKGRLPQRFMFQGQTQRFRELASGAGGC